MCSGQHYLLSELLLSIPSPSPAPQNTRCAPAHRLLRIQDQTPAFVAKPNTEVWYLWVAGDILAGISPAASTVHG